MSWIDLHMHSNISTDGEFSPAKLMQLCAAAELKVASLADHNSVRGIAEAAQQAAQGNIEFISGIELDCQFGTVGLHLLGYGIDETQPIFAEIDELMIQQEKDNSQKLIDQVEKLGIRLDHDTIWQMAIDNIVTPEIIAEVALLHPENADNHLLQPYRPGGEFCDNPFVNFYWSLCAPGKPAYVDRHIISLQHALNTIHDAGGVAILAHPGNNIKMDKNLAMAIIDQGVQGFEVYSSYHSTQETQFYKLLAEEYQLLSTVGSDFHGKTKPAVALGGVSCDEKDEMIYRALIAAIRKQ
ncbi:MAG: PHP domain-containing protein [Anaerolineaceae bacterium]|nr:PHP domain-containing protein [Anaerolineaceae bacterium]